MIGRWSEFMVRTFLLRERPSLSARWQIDADLLLVHQIVPRPGCSGPPGVSRGTDL